MSLRRSSLVPHHPVLRRTSVKDLRGEYSSLTTSTRGKVAQNSKQSTPSTDSSEHEKRSNASTTSKRLVSTTPRNQVEPNSVKNRRLLAELLQDKATKKNDNGDRDESDRNQDTETEKQDTSLWRELVHIKDRLEKLEVTEGGDANNASTTTTGSTAIGASPPLRRLTVHQRRLQGALVAFEQSQPPAMARAMSAVVTEAIHMNQQLWQSIPRDLDAKTLVALQKSSDAQLKALTETLIQLCSQSRPPLPLPPVAGITPQSLSLTQQQQQQATRMPPVSENGTSNSGSSQHRRRSFKVGGLVDYPDFNSGRGAQTAAASPRYSEPRYSNHLYDR